MRLVFVLCIPTLQERCTLGCWPELGLQFVIPGLPITNTEEQQVKEDQSLSAVPVGAKRKQHN